MSDGRALLAAICAHPDEDTPRLAYADWLDEHVGSMPKDKRESVRMRAELIRVQCELAAMAPEEEDADTATRRVELEFRAEALLKNPSRRRSWAKPLTPPPEGCPDLVPNEHVFIRGFPQFARIARPESYLTAGEAFCDIAPVESIKCYSINGTFADRFYSQPWLPRVRRLTGGTGGEVGSRAENAERLFAEPGLANLEELDLSGWEFRPPGAPVADRVLSRLRAFNFATGRWNGSATYERLGELLPTETRLRDFYLTHAQADADDVRTALALPQFAAVERLAFADRYSSYYFGTSPPPSVDVVKALAAAPCWLTLRTLHDAQQRRFGAAEVEALAAAPPAPNLRTLTLCSGNLGGAVAALAASPLLASVTSLNLGRTEFGDTGAIALARSPHLGRLVHLNLAHSDIGPKGLKALAESAFAPDLVRLNVNGCPIRKGGIDALVSASFPRLKRVDAVWAAKNTAQKQRLRVRFGDGVRFD